MVRPEAVFWSALPRFYSPQATCVNPAVGSTVPSPALRSGARLLPGQSSPHQLRSSSSHQHSPCRALAASRTSRSIQSCSAELLLSGSTEPVDRGRRCSAAKGPLRQPSRHVQLPLLARKAAFCSDRAATDLALSRPVNFLARVADRCSCNSLCFLLIRFHALVVIITPEIPCVSKGHHKHVVVCRCRGAGTASSAGRRLRGRCRGAWWSSHARRAARPRLEPPGRGPGAGTASPAPAASHTPARVLHRSVVEFCTRGHFRTLQRFALLLTGLPGFLDSQHLSANREAVDHSSQPSVCLPVER
jgi:hypothetical protein